MGADASCSVSKEPHPADESPIIFSAPTGPHLLASQAESPQVISRFQDCPQIGTIYELFEHTKASSPHSDYYGKRAFEDGKWQNRFEFIDRTVFASYRDAVGSFLISKLEPSESNIGIMSYNRMEWVILQQACFSMSLTLIPIYETFGWENTKFVINHASIKRLFVISTRATEIISHLSDLPTIKDLIVIDSEENPLDISKVPQSQIKVSKFSEAINFPSRFPHRPPKPSSPAMIMYTSGTTGRPKGCIITHSNLIASAAAYTCTVYPFAKTDSYLSYLPLSHVFEVILHVIGLHCLGKIAFYSGNLSRMSEEIKMLSPTAIVGVPRVFERIMQGIQAKLDQKSFLLKAAFSSAFAIKSTLIRRLRLKKALGIDLAFNPIRDAFGRNLKIMVCGGSFLSTEIQHWLRVACNVEFIQAYGMTESSAVGISQVHTDLTDGDLGVVLRSVEAKFKQTNEGGYDITKGVGELMLRGPSVFSGYYQDEEETKKVLKDGWLSTGDLFELGQEGRMHMVGRAKEIMKLSQGEYVSLPKLAAVYLTVPYLYQIYIHAGLASRYLTAVGVLNSKQPGFQNVTTDEIIQMLNKRADEYHLNGFERIKAIHLTTEAFTVENGQLTPSMKQCPHRIYEAYKNIITQLEASIRG